MLVFFVLVLILKSGPGFPTEGDRAPGSLSMKWMWCSALNEGLH